MRHRFFAAGRFGSEASPWVRHAAWRFRRGGFGFGAFGAGWGRSTRRGDVKFLVLETLADSPRHGYDVINAIEERYGFRPSAGSIYPTLQMLEDAGHVKGREEEGKRVYEITASGKELLGKRPAADEDGDFDSDTRHRVRSAAKMLMMAVLGARGCDEAVLEKVAQALEKARKEIYSALAETEL